VKKHIAILVALLVVAACTPASPEVIEKEVIVEKLVVETVIVEKVVKETVIVEKIVEVEPAPELGADLIGELEGPDIIRDPEQFPTEFNEAPELAELVASGDLPPVEERLPVREDLLVLEPLDEIGTYGGTWRRGFTGPGDGYNAYRCCSGTDYPLFKDYSWNELTPNVCKDWEINDEGTVITLYLREGMKWSDGHPFTSEDWMFWYDDIYTYEGLSYSDGSLKISGESGVMEALDETTIQITFQSPYPYFLNQLAGRFGPASASGYKGLYAPKHYLSQFHPKYAGEDEVIAMAEEGGFETWPSLFKAKAHWNKNVELPSLTPWIQVVPNTEPVWVFERNPYYWGVDSAGNQLPYIDRVEMTLAENLEVLNLRAIAGEYDLQARHLDVAKLPVFLENQEKAGYKVTLDVGGYGSEFQIRPNQNYDLDDEIRKWFQNVDFRRALSLGIRRDQINEVFFLGLGVSGSPIPDPTNPYYPGDEYRTLWHTHDPDLANQMLDDIGLSAKDSEGYRLRTDNGDRLVIQMITVGGQFVPFTAIGEMIQEHWQDIGIFVDVKEVDRALSDEWEASGEIQLYIWNNDGTDHEPFNNKKIFPFDAVNVMARHWGEWYATQGESGEEPPDYIKEAQAMNRKAFTVPQAEQIVLGQEMWKIHVDQVMAIGTVGLAPGGMAVRVNNVKLGNIPAKMVNGPRPKNPASARPQTFFYRE